MTFSLISIENSKVCVVLEKGGLTALYSANVAVVVHFKFDDSECCLTLADLWQFLAVSGSRI